MLPLRPVPSSQLSAAISQEVDELQRCAAMCRLMCGVLRCDHVSVTYPCLACGAVDMLKGPLEADVLEASEACWTMDARTVQVTRAGITCYSSCRCYEMLLAGFRSRARSCSVSEPDRSK